MKFSQALSAAAAAAALLAAVPAAHAVPTLQFVVDGGGPITCADGAACDSNSAVGVVTFIGALGAFNINVTTGVSKPALNAPQLMDLNSVNLQSGGGAHTLQMLFSDTGFSGGGIVVGTFGGTINSGASITANAYYGAGLFDTTNSLLSMGPFSAAAFAAGTSGVVTSASYSLTQELFLSTVGPMSFSGDYSLDIPEPGSIALAGLALLALGVTRRRRAA